MFAKRHYEYLAHWVAQAVLCTTDDMIRPLIAYSLADWLERDNPRFNRQRFLTACGVKS